MFICSRRSWAKLEFLSTPKNSLMGLEPDGFLRLLVYQSSGRAHLKLVLYLGEKESFTPFPNERSGVQLESLKPRTLPYPNAGPETWQTSG